MTLNPEVLYVGRSMLITDVGFYSLKLEAEHICLLVFLSVTHLTQSPAGPMYTVHPLYAYLRQILKVQFSLRRFIRLWL